MNSTPQGQFENAFPPGLAGFLDKHQAAAAAAAAAARHAVTGCSDVSAAASELQTCARTAVPCTRDVLACTSTSNGFFFNYEEAIKEIVTL